MNTIKTIAIAALIGAIGITGYSYAKADDVNTSNPMDSAIEAGVIDQETADSLRDFRQEQHQEMRQERLTEAVEEGTITEDEAQQIRDWEDSRPEAMDKLGGFGHGKMRGGMGRGGECATDTQAS
jgi:hypothetical protein